MKRKNRMCNMKYRKILTSSKMRSRELIKGRLEERGSGQATANPRFHYATLIRYYKDTTIPTLRSGHEDPELSESNPTSTYNKASWRA